MQNLTFNEQGIIQKYIHKLKHVSSIENKYVEKLHSMSFEDRNTLIEKVILKYNSDEYINKEYRLGREPSRELFNILYIYAVLYGIELDIENEEIFCVSKYLIDNYYVLRLYIGQGSLITIEYVSEK